MNLLELKKEISKYKSIIKYFNQENTILKSGLDDFHNIIIWYLPIVLAVILYGIGYLFRTNLETYSKNLISILPSLIGFLIASATILITVNGDSINKKHNNTYTYKQIGGAIFFYATKISFFLLVLSFVATDHLLEALNYYIYQGVSLVIILYFSKLIISILYGLMFLTATIEIEGK